MTKFDSCFYTDFGNTLDCTCFSFYIGFIEPLKMKLGECKKWSFNDLAKIVNSTVNKHANDEKYMNERIKELSCRKSLRKWNPTMAKLKITDKSRSINTYEVCTCGPDGCDESAAKKVTFKPDVPDDTSAFPDSSNGNHQTINYCFNLK